MNNLVLLDGNKISGGINYITPECYSTEEREVGCWVDGKPLYQKSVATGGSVPSGATLIQRIVQTEYDTLLYTKTTDTAGSGTWTPSGIPAVHYSTEEHVIGTWIDGRTLYEKTITIAALPSDTEAVEYTISNETINLLSYEGTVTFQSGNKGSLPYTNIAPDVTTVDNIKSAIISTQINANGKFWIRCGRDRSNCSAVVTVRYTKAS